MRERAGFIIGISGVVLLLKPNFDPDQMAMYFNYLVGNYWPAILIIIGLLRKRRKQEGKADRCHLTKMVLSISLRSRKQVAV